MSDRGVFVAASLTVVLIVAGAFALPQFFFFELAKSTIFIAIAVLVFFGEDRYTYMLGMVAPPVWFLADIIVGGFFQDFEVLGSYLTMKEIGPLDTPLHALARLAGVLLVILSYRAWNKEVTEKLFGRTFRISLVVSIIYAVALAVWYLRGIAG
ncbi:MAG: hypothetical protein ACE145_16850 [Terriglobia bacterium]